MTTPNQTSEIASPSETVAVALPRATPTGIAPLRVRLISAGFWSFFGRAASIGLFFVADMVLSRALSKSAFASMYMATSLAAFISATVALGADQLLTKVVRQTFYGPHPERTFAVIRSGTRVLVVGAIASACFFVFVLPHVINAVGWIYGDVAQLDRLVVNSLTVVVWGCLLGACVNSAYVLQGLDDFRTAVLVGARRGGLLPNVAFLAFSLATWWSGHISVPALIASQCAFQAMALLYGHFAVRRKVTSFAPVQLANLEGGPAEQAPTATWFFRQSLPFFIGLMAQMVIDELDALVVGSFVGDAEVADYAAARRLVRVMSMAYVMFAMSMGPFIAELLGKGEVKRLERIMRASATFLCLPMLAIFGLYMLVPDLVLRFAFGAKFEDAASTLRLLTLGQVVFVVMGGSSQTLLMAGRQRTLMVCSLASLVIYCVAAPLVISRFGLTGAAVIQSTIVGAQAIAVTLLAKRQVGIWTVATLSPQSLRQSLGALAGRRRDSADEIRPLEALEAAADAGLAE